MSRPTEWVARKTRARRFKALEPTVVSVLNGVFLTFNAEDREPASPAFIAIEKRIPRKWYEEKTNK